MWLLTKIVQFGEISNSIRHGKLWNEIVQRLESSKFYETGDA
jgi:hypothetical protein